MKESRFWWAFSCRSLDSLMPQWCWLIQIEERNSWPALHQPAINIGKYHIVEFASNLFRNFNVILKRGEVENPFKHAASCVFYVILYHSWVFSNNKILVALRGGEHKALYVTYKVLKIFEGWEWNIVDIWHQQRTLLNNQQVSEMRLRIA